MSVIGNYTEKEMHLLCQDLQLLGTRGHQHVSLITVIHPVIKQRCLLPQTVPKNRCFLSRLFKAKSARVGHIFQHTVSLLISNKDQLKDKEFVNSNLKAVTHLKHYFSTKAGLSLNDLNSLIADLKTAAFEVDPLEKAKKEAKKVKDLADQTLTQTIEDSAKEIEKLQSALEEERKSFTYAEGQYKVLSNRAKFDLKKIVPVRTDFISPLIDDEQTSDVTLNSLDTPIKVHSLVVALRAPTLHVLLLKEGLQKPCMSYVLAHLHVPKEFKEWLYKGKLFFKSSSKDAVPLLNLFRFLKISPKKESRNGTSISFWF